MKKSTAIGIIDEGRSLLGKIAVLLPFRGGSAEEDRKLATVRGLLAKVFTALLLIRERAERASEDDGYALVNFLARGVRADVVALAAEMDDSPARERLIEWHAHLDLLIRAPAVAERLVVTSTLTVG